MAASTTAPIGRDKCGRSLALLCRCRCKCSYTRAPWLAERLGDILILYIFSLSVCGWRWIPLAGWHSDRWARTEGHSLFPLLLERERGTFGLSKSLGDWERLVLGCHVKRRHFTWDWFAGPIRMRAREQRRLCSRGMEVRLGCRWKALMRQRDATETSSLVILRCPSWLDFDY